MNVTVRIPTPLRNLTSGQDKVVVAGDNLQAVINALESDYPGIKSRLCDETGQLRNFVNVYVNGEDVRFTGGLSTITNAGDEVSVVPAVAGGK